VQLRVNAFLLLITSDISRVEDVQGFQTTAIGSLGLCNSEVYIVHSVGCPFNVLWPDKGESNALRDFKLPLWCKRDLHASAMLHSVYW
jgi:hypothetical protein